jgi:hypothetical protein
MNGACGGTWKKLRNNWPRIKNKGDIRKTEAARRKIVRPGGKERADYYGRLNAAVTEREQQVQALQRRNQAFKNLQAEVERYAFATFPQLLGDMQRTHSQAALTEAEWSEFRPKFSGSPTTMLRAKIEILGKDVRVALSPSTLTPGLALTAEQLGTCSLQALNEARDEVGKEISVDDRNAQRLEQLNKQHATLVANGRRLEELVKQAQGSTERLRQLFEEREQCYEEFFGLIVEHCDVLKELYEPLHNQLGAQSRGCAGGRRRYLG